MLSISDSLLIAYIIIEYNGGFMLFSFQTRRILISASTFAFSPILPNVISILNNKLPPIVRLEWIGCYRTSETQPLVSSALSISWDRGKSRVSFILKKQMKITYLFLQNGHLLVTNKLRNKTEHLIKFST